MTRECECELPTVEGPFRCVAYRDTIDKELHLALVLGNIDPERPTLVRVHLQNTLCDLFGTQHNACGWPLRDAMRQVATAGEGVIVVLRNRDGAADLLTRLRDFQLHDSDDVVPARRQDRNELRTYGIGAQILVDLGVRKMRVMSAPKAMHAISGFDLEVVEYTGGGAA